MNSITEVPNRLKIGAKYYDIHTDLDHWARVVLEYELREGTCGHTDNRALMISISPNQSSSEFKDTLLHEVLHAVWAQGPDIGATMDDIGEDGREEYLVGRQSPWLLQVLQDNPLLFEFLGRIDI